MCCLPFAMLMFIPHFGESICLSYTLIVVGGRVGALWGFGEARPYVEFCGLTTITICHNPKG